MDDFYKNLSQKQMREILRDTAAQCLALSLLQECDYRQNKSGSPENNPADNSGTFKTSPPVLASILAEKSAFIDYSPSFVGYCKAVLVLVKAAFSHKKPKRFVVIGW